MLGAWSKKQVESQGQKQVESQVLGQKKRVLGAWSETQVKSQALSDHGLRTKHQELISDLKS